MRGMRVCVCVAISLCVRASESQSVPCGGVWERTVVLSCTTAPPYAVVVVAASPSLSLSFRSSSREEEACGVGSLYPIIETHTHIHMHKKLSYYIYPASSRATVPAEFKHINKRRKRNQQGFP